MTTPRTEDQIREAIGSGPAIARGMGRAYGDSALNPNLTIDMTRFNRMISFDSGSGVLVAEAGVVLGDIVDAFLPRGWFPPVTPGTKFVTIGGMIAADVHGKNHHKHGSFGNHVEWIDLMVADGSAVRCSRQEETELFHATIGGMGLTGIVLRAAFRMRAVASGWIRQETVAADHLDATFRILDASKTWTYSVGWIDCRASGRSLGRSLVFRGEHAALEELGPRQHSDVFAQSPRHAKRVPIDLPCWSLNRLTVKAFNALYYRHGQRGASARLIDWDRYFYPLDAIRDWNRIYGKQGFVQFQCVVPTESARSGLTRILEATASAGQGSFLAVLKLLGAQDGTYSFPMEGVTLALDFPASSRALDLVDRLYRLAIDHGGRFYLAKYARLTRTLCDLSDPRTAWFREFRARTGATRHFSSTQSERLGI